MEMGHQQCFYAANQVPGGEFIDVDNVPVG